MSNQHHLPEFNHPPVVETVLGVQFKRLEAFCAAHAGWFWKNCLDESWGTANEAQRMREIFETFGKNRRWHTPSLEFSKIESSRLQIINDDETRMIQIQDDHFYCNWRRKADGAYPSYKTLLPEFLEKFGLFQDFLRSQNLGVAEPNQWEVTYVNHIFKGTIWSDLEDWKHVFPELPFFGANLPNQRFDSFTGVWQLELGEQQGRLYIDIDRARIGDRKGPEAIVLKFVSRGPIPQDGNAGLQGFFDVGHEAIVRTFDSITSIAAHEQWGKRNG
jgi:uncharacterized protein (TIGR04255 family)